MESIPEILLKCQTLAWPCAAPSGSETKPLPKMSTNGERPKGTILITGLNGYLAGRTAELVLREGYRVRGTVRDKLAGQKVKVALCRLGYSADDIDVVQISDICRPNSLELAADGCCAIFHLASPLTEIWTLPPSEVVRIAVESTASVLRAAMKAGRVINSVVLVSSAAALFDLPIENRLYTEKDWNKISEQIVDRDGDKAGGFHAYLASKTAAERYFWKFRDDYRPSFGMTALQPTYFIGQPLIPWKTPEDIPYSNSDFWKVVSGEEVPGPMMVYGDTVDVQDVARMLLWSAQHPKKADGERFVCSSAVGGGQAITDILRKHMPFLKIQQGKRGQGYSIDYKPRAGMPGFDSRKAVLMTGRDWIPYEQSVIDLAQFLQRYLPS